MTSPAWAHRLTHHTRTDALNPKVAAAARSISAAPFALDEHRSEVADPDTAQFARRHCPPASGIRQPFRSGSPFCPSKSAMDRPSRSVQKDPAGPSARSQLFRAEHTAEKSLLFARRVALRSTKIRFAVALVIRRRPVVLTRRVGKTRSRTRWVHVMMGTKHRVPPVVHSCGVRDPAQGHQNAQGHNRTHRFFLQRLPPPAQLQPRRSVPNKDRDIYLVLEDFGLRRARINHKPRAV